jgi:uncharacterized membrane protein
MEDGKIPGKTKQNERGITKRDRFWSYVKALVAGYLTVGVIIIATVIFTFKDTTLSNLPDRGFLDVMALAWLVLGYYMAAKTYYPFYKEKRQVSLTESVNSGNVIEK